MWSWSQSAMLSTKSYSLQVWHSSEQTPSLLPVLAPFGLAQDEGFEIFMHCVIREYPLQAQRQDVQRSLAKVKLKTSWWSLQQVVHVSAKKLLQWVYRQKEWDQNMKAKSLSRPECLAQHSAAHQVPPHTPAGGLGIGRGHCLTTVTARSIDMRKTLLALSGTSSASLPVWLAPASQSPSRPECSPKSSVDCVAIIYPSDLPSPSTEC